jgi:hypothetical protein
VVMSSTPVATMVHSKNGHGDITMSVATVPVYKELDTIPHSFSSDRHNASHYCLSVRWQKKLKMRG